MNKKTIWTLLIIILILGGFLRLYKLSSIPPGLYPDEAINGNNAYEALRNHSFKVFYPENNGREGLFINTVAYSIKFFGLKPQSIRLVSAIAGLFSILGIYLLAKILFDSELIALSSSFLLAISFWHINFSRIGFRGIFLPLILTFGFYFLFLAIKEKDYFYLAWAGFIFGLGFYSYIAYRIIPLLWLVVAYLDCKNSSNKKNFFLRWLTLGLLIFLITIPLLNYFYQHPEDFFSRSKGLSVFATNQPLKVLILNTIKTLGMFNFAGDCNWRHNFACQPQLWYIEGVFFILGTIFLLKALKNKKEKDSALFLLSWLIIFLLPEILTNEGIPHALRSIGTIPAVFIISGYGVKIIYDFFKKHLSKKTIVSVALVLALILISVNFYRYFYLWANNKEVKGAFSYNWVILAKKINQAKRTREKYIIVEASGVLVKERGTDRFLPMPAQTVMFLTKSFLPSDRTYHHIHYLNKDEAAQIPPKALVFRIK